MATDRRYKPLGSGLPGKTSFDIADLTVGDVPQWNATTSLWDNVDLGDTYYTEAEVDALFTAYEPDTLYWTGAERVEAVEYGTNFRGDNAGTYGQLIMKHGITPFNNIWALTAGNGAAVLHSYEHGAPLRLTAENVSGVSKYLAEMDPDAGSKFYYAGTEVFETYAANAVNVKATGTSAIVYMTADGRQGRVYESAAGDLYIDNIYSGGDIFIQTYNGSVLETGISIIEGGAVNLYYDGSLRAYTSSYGLVIGDGADRAPASTGDGHLKILGNGYNGFVTMNSSGITLGSNSASRYVGFAVDETVTAFFDGTRLYLKHISGTSPYIDFRGSNDVQDMYIQSSGDLAYYWRGFNNGSYFYIAGDNAGGTHQAVIIADPDNYTDIYAAGYLGIRVGNATLGFFNNSGNAKQTITGSRGGNAALASLLTALANHGLITNSTT